MRKPLLGGIGLALALALSCSACSGEGGGGGAQPAEAGTAVQAYEGDLAFVDGIVPHDLTAVWMAEDAIAKARRPELRAFATKVKASRTREIAELLRYRRTWVGEDETPPIEDDTIVTVPAGRDFDRRWTQAMIRHHQAAIEIAERAVREAETPEARKLAKSIAEKEKADKAQLQRWERAWPRE